ncbi:hypothetical protein J132_02666 [Termitomyces sp. J132]|nr:hypothetical protein J132_02666 [Termitomyces sp. J132]
MSSDPPPKLTDFRYMIFDVYGTLADWESGLYNALQPLLSGFSSASKWSRDDAIRTFLSVEGDIQAQHPTMLYSDLLAKAHELLEARESSASGSTPPADNKHTIFGKSIRKWEPFSDSAKALKELSEHFHLIVLSNVDHASFAYTHSYLSEGTFPSAATDDIQQASPLYRSKDATMPVTPPTLEEIKAKTLSVAQSLTHDHRPAKELGITSVWIDRQSASWRPIPPDNGSGYGWSWRFESLRELAQAVTDDIEDQ